MLVTRDSCASRCVALAPGETKERDLSWFDWSLLSDLSRTGRWCSSARRAKAEDPGYSAYMRITDGSPAVRLGEGNGLGSLAGRRVGSGDPPPGGGSAARGVSHGCRRSEGLPVGRLSVFERGLASRRQAVHPHGKRARPRVASIYRRRRGRQAPGADAGGATAGTRSRPTDVGDGSGPTGTLPLSAREGEPTADSGLASEDALFSSARTDGFLYVRQRRSPARCRRLEVASEKEGTRRTLMPDRSRRASSVLPHLARRPKLRVLVRPRPVRPLLVEGLR